MGASSKAEEETPGGEACPSKMVANVRLCSSWGIATLVCLIVVHFDTGAGLPLHGEQGKLGGSIELLEMAEHAPSKSILQQLEEAEKLGSGEVAYSQAGSKGGASRLGRSHRKALPVGKAMHPGNGLDYLVAKPKKAPHARDMFSEALADWNNEKTALEKTSSERKQLLDTDLSNQRETHLEEQTVASVGSEPVSMAAKGGPLDPLADFKKRVSDSSSSSVDSMPLIKLEAPKPKAPAGNAKKSNNWMTDALAAWGQEEDQTLDAPSLTNVVASKIDGDGDGGDQGERGDLGESDELIVLPRLKKVKLGESTGAKVKVKVNDGVDAKAAATEQNLDTEIESEAQEAASEVVKSTMDSVERDFLFAEKAITTKLGENAPELTLDDLDKAGGKAKRDKAEADAKKAHKQMVQKAEQNYELAIANVKKVTQQKLADELVGLKMKLRNEEDKILAESKTASQKAKA